MVSVNEFEGLEAQGTYPAVITFPQICFMKSVDRIRMKLSPNWIDLWRVLPYGRANLPGGRQPVQSAHQSSSLVWGGDLGVGLQWSKASGAARVSRWLPALNSRVNHRMVGDNFGTGDSYSHQINLSFIWISFSGAQWLEHWGRGVGD